MWSINDVTNNQMTRGRTKVPCPGMDVPIKQYLNVTLESWVIFLKTQIPRRLIDIVLTK